jgi:phosphate:Na+ symporter
MPSELITAFSAAGGLALFLLAMAMMTDGLKVFGGQKLKVLLRDWTSSPLRGVLSGALITAFVQSSSAVTVATLGFVNAGILTLRQALGVVFGANVGTTMTGWLVSVTGLDFRIEAFALPVLAAGVALRMTASSKRLRGLGDALAGFGLFFLGLAILKDTFSGIAATLSPSTVNDMSGVAAAFAFLGLGFLATLVTQSSSAAIAIILTAATESVIGFNVAAAAVIGANIGTTSTAMLAVINATPNAKRVAAGHLVFNLVTGVIAVSMLPVFLAVITAFSLWAGMGDHPAPLLALFHTTFNLLGVAVLLPFTGQLANRLMRLFHTAEEDLGKPQHLDANILATPTLALAALRGELKRLLVLVCRLVLGAAHDAGVDRARLRREAAAVFALGETISAFATDVRMEQLPRGDAEELARALRIARYLKEGARLAPEIEWLRSAAQELPDVPARAPLGAALDAAGVCLELFAEQTPAADARKQTARALRGFQRAYQHAKAAVFAAAARHVLNAEQAGALLDALSRSRRAVEQIAKASRMLRRGRDD